MISEHDLSLLGQLTFDSRAEPNFDLLKYCLVWPDERPAAPLSAEGNEFLGDLWIIRGFIHRAVPRDQWGLDPQYFEDVWKFGLANMPGWPGFRRLTLNAADSEYMAHCLSTSLSSL